MADKKLKNAFMSRRKVTIPHYDVGGVVTPGGGGLFGTIGSGLTGLAGDFTTQNQYNATLAPTAQTDYSGVIGGAGANAMAGYGNFQQNQGQQQNLANALQNVSTGAGPNPAQNMLNQATGANVSNQAALMAGQRGSGANVGMMARQAAMAGSGAQQQAAGQAATLQSQQQLNAMNQQGAVLGQMGNQGIQEQNANTSLYGAGVGGQNAQNNSMINNYGMAEGLNQKSSQSNADATNKTAGGLMNGLGGAMSMLGLAKGGQVPSHMAAMHSIYHADGGEIKPTATATGTSTSTATGTGLSIDQRKAKELKLKDIMDPNSTADIGFATGGEVDDYIEPHDFHRVSKYVITPKRQADIDGIKSKEGLVSGDDLPSAVKPSSQLPSSVIGATDYRSGGPVGGQSRVAGDSLQNDTQPAMLSPKEIVLPRHVTMAPDAPEKAAEFVAAILKKQGHGNSKQHKEFHRALKQAILSRKK